MSKKPAFMFYPGDWLRSIDLQSCSLTAQGLMIKLMCFMHDSPEYGKLLLKQNDKQTSINPLKLARMVGLSKEELDELLAELLDAGVLKKDEKTGIIFSNRMVKDEKIRVIRAESGKKGGKKTQEEFAKAKPQAKDKQNPEDEYANEDVNENKDEIEKGSTGGEIIYPYDDERFLQAWGIWRMYKKEQYGFTYKPIGEQAALSKVSRLTETPDQAIALIRNSIENGWRGLFEEKNGTNVNKAQQQHQVLDDYFKGFN